MSKVRNLFDFQESEKDVVKDKMHENEKKIDELKKEHETVKRVLSKEVKKVKKKILK